MLKNLICPKCESLDINTKLIGVEIKTYCNNCQYYGDNYKFTLEYNNNNNLKTYRNKINLLLKQDYELWVDVYNNNDWVKIPELRHPNKWKHVLIKPKDIKITEHLKNNPNSKIIITCNNQPSEYDLISFFKQYDINNNYEIINDSIKPISIISKDELIKKLSKKWIKYNTILLKYVKKGGKKPQDYYNYFGGLEIGKLQGKITLIEDLLDDLDISIVDNLEKKLKRNN